jgi:hypothetical protein
MEKRTENIGFWMARAILGFLFLSILAFRVHKPDSKFHSDPVSFQKNLRWNGDVALIEPTTSSSQYSASLQNLLPHHKPGELLSVISVSENAIQLKLKNAESQFNQIKPELLRIFLPNPQVPTKGEVPLIS